MQSNTNRKAMYAKIAIARKQLGMDDDVYRLKLINDYGKSSATELTDYQLTFLLNDFSRLGASFTSKNSKPRKAEVKTPHTRHDWVEITPSMPFCTQKRQILAIWKKLGYSMCSLDTRVKREFGCPTFTWLKEEKAIIALLTDLQKRERAFMKREEKKLAKDCQKHTGCVLPRRASETETTLSVSESECQVGRLTEHDHV